MHVTFARVYADDGMIVMYRAYDTYGNKLASRVYVNDLYDLADREGWAVVSIYNEGECE